MTLRQPPTGFKGHPAWEAFELLAETRGYGEQQDDWEVWWDCFYAGFEIGLAEAG